MMPNNIMQLLPQLMQNPAQVLSRAGLNIPANMNDPNAIIQHLMNSGQITQERYNQVRQMVSQFKR
jgi:hypothetical protein